MMDRGDFKFAQCLLTAAINGGQHKLAYLRLKFMVFLSFFLSLALLSAEIKVT